MTRLYEWPPTRSQRARWALEELEIEYSSQLVDLTQGQQDSTAYRALHPLGVVPVLETDRYTIFETVAIVLQLIDEHPQKKLAPAIGTPERAYYYQWCVFACAELDPAIMQVFDNAFRPGVPRDAGLAEHGRSLPASRAELLTNALADRAHLLGADFSGADILIGHSCFMATVTGLIDGVPQLAAYYDRLKQRPAYQRAYASAPTARASAGTEDWT